MITVEELLGNVAPAPPGKARKVIRWDDSMPAREEREKRARSKRLEARRRYLEMALAAEKGKIAAAEARIRKIMSDFALVQE